MTDSCILLRRLLLATPAFVTALGTGAVNIGTLLAGDNLDAAPCVVLTAAGGVGSHAEILELQQRRVQVRVWTGINQWAAARTLYSVVQQAAHGAQNKSFSTDGFLCSCLEVVAAQDVVDRDTGWATLVAFYEVTSRN